jgi:7-carboxy-7-deazaguanine synthase
MFGKNPKRQSTQGDGTSLEVQSVFKTFQGEGPYTGWPAVFIRLGGCNLACDFCDTEFEDFHATTCQQLLEQTQALATSESTGKSVGLVVITGGEPLRQPIELLCQMLLERGFKVQIETNGTLFRPLPKGVEVVCSPKAGARGYHAIRADLLPYISAFKFIVSKQHLQYQDVGEVGQSHSDATVYLQPMDEYDVVKNQENYAHTLALAARYGYNLSLQSHKIWGIA